MKPEDKIQEPLSVEVLQAYLHGTLSASQQERVRQLIADSPLYQDALEGLKYVADDYPLETTIEQINKKVTGERKRTERIVWFRPLAAAASLIVLLGVTYIIYVTMSRPDTERMYAEHYDKYPVTGRAAQESSASSLSFDSIAPMEEPTATPPVATLKTPESEMAVVKDEAEVALNYDVEMEEEDVPFEMSEPDAVPTAPPAPVVEQQNKVVTKSTHSDYGNAAPVEERQQLLKANKEIENGNAVNELSSVSGVDMQTSAVSLANARMLYEANDYENALVQFNQYLEANPDHSESLFYSSLCLMELEQHKDALNRLEQVLDLPQSEYTEPAAWYRALTLIKLDKIKKAKSALEDIYEAKGTYAEQAKEMLDQL